MASTLILKNGTGSAVPSALTHGEPAINVSTGLFYYGSGSGGGATVKTLSNFTHITASSDISSSGTINATDYLINNKNAIDYTSGTNTILYGQTNQNLKVRGYTILLGGAADQHVTASGNISASGTIIANKIESDQLFSRVGDANTGIQLGSDTVQIEANDTLLANFNTNRVELNRPVTASNDISSSGVITGASIASDATFIVTQGGTGATSFTDKSVIITQDSGTDTLAAVAMSTNGQLLIGGSSGPAVATLTAGNGIAVTNADGGITIATNLTAGDGLTLNTADIDLDASLTTVTSVLNTGLVVGRDATDQIKFGTDNQIIFRVDGADGVTFKASGEIEATKFDGALEGNADTATTATNATHVTVTDNESTNEENLIPFIEGASATGNVGLESDGDFAYNPSTGTVSATIFKGTTSLQTPLIEFTDGDDAILIADGGGVTIDNLTVTDEAIEGTLNVSEGTLTTSPAQNLSIIQGAGSNIDIGAYGLRAQTLESDVATGTAPFTVASTTRVANLMATTVGTITGLAPDTATTQAAQGNITSLGTLSALTVSGDINANGNIVGDDGTDITNIATLDVVGLAAAATFEPDGDTAAGDNAAIGYTAAEGLILTGQGSTNDVTIKNDADADVIEIPTGTTNVNVVGELTAATYRGTPFIIGKESGYLGSFSDDNYYYGNNQYGWNHHSVSGKLPNSPLGTFSDQTDGGTAVGNTRQHTAQIVPVACKNITLMGEADVSTDGNTFAFFIYKTTRMNGSSTSPTITQIGTTSVTLANASIYYNIDITTTEGVSAGDKILVVIRPGGTSGQVRWNYTLFGYTNG